MSLLLIPIAISLLDISLERIATIIAPSSQNKLHEILKSEAMKSNTQINAIYLLGIKSQTNEEGSSREKSAESYNSSFLPENGVSLSRNPSGEGKVKS